jgi:nitrite reductase (NADH) small subunit
MESNYVTVARRSDLPPVGALEVAVNGRKIAIFKTASGIYAIDAECPHKGGPLAVGWVENDCVYCPLHGWEFDLRTGYCRRERKSVTSYRVRTVGEEVQVAA